MRSVVSILDSLSYHKPDARQVESIALLRGAAKQLATEIAELSGDGRCCACAMTKLEECLMWATKGVILDTDDGATEGERV